jgi:signal transduction histidine kinase
MPESLLSQGRKIVGSAADLRSAASPVRPAATRGQGRRPSPSKVADGLLRQADAQRPLSGYGQPVGSLLARRLTDVLIVALAAGAQAEAWTDPTQVPRAVTIPAALLWTLPLLARRRHPLLVSAVVLGTVAGLTALPGDVVGGSMLNSFAIIGAFCVAGGHPNPRRALAAGGVGYLALTAIVLVDIENENGAVPVFLISAAAWALGRSLADRTRREEDLQRRAEQAEREHEAAAMAERTRIASELHDVIAHSVSVMTIQAGAARMLLDENPEKAREPLVAVEETGHQALGEMRRLLGVLRGTAGDAEVAPQPGLAQLDGLLEQVRAAGLTVDVAAEGTARPLPPGIDLTAFRVVQEALTNVLKHGGAARAHVRVRFESDAVELEITNSGRPPGDGPAGYGLIGMRQRVAMYAGELDAGPREGGGFRVRARLPLTGTAA